MDTPKSARPAPSRLARQSVWLWVAIAGLLIALVWVVFSELTRVRTPVQAATISAERYVAGDLEWLYDHLSDREKAVLPKEVFEGAYLQFVAPYLEGAEVLRVERVYDSINKGVVKVVLKGRGGETFEPSVLGYLEESGVVVAGIEDIVSFHYRFKYKDLPFPASIKASWHEVHTWLAQRGIKEWYSTQDDTYRPVKADATTPQQ